MEWCPGWEVIPAVLWKGEEGCEKGVVLGVGGKECAPAKLGKSRRGSLVVEEIEEKERPL